MFCHQIINKKVIWMKSLGLKNQMKFGISNLKLNPQRAFTEGKRYYSSTVDLKKGQVLNGFVVDEITPIKEMYLTAVRLTHINTGAQYLHLDRDDNNNVFCIGFRTTPVDSTGLPHILEHIALCGSENYPCRDPFFKMLRRSLATFMNAMTAPDYTMYPFSTQNLKDFRNLQSVYLDSVFKPQLRELDFYQEGWRLEHTNPNDKTSPIIIKGVVYNEMKGVFNSNQNIFATRLLNSLLPSHTYGVMSGGDPLEIPKLEYHDLVNFHAFYYHPSNAKFYSYGNFSLKDHLKFVDDKYLAFSDKIDTTITKVPAEQRWSIPKTEHIFCKHDPLAADSNKQNAIAIASLCNDICNLQESYDLYILTQLLLDGPNAAFYKSLIDTNIGSGFGPMTGYESQIKDTIFTVSLQDVHDQDFEKVKKIYDETLSKVIENGFEKDHVEAILHRIELQTKHQSSNFGLNLLYSIMPLWNHDADIVDSLKINKAVQNFRNTMKKNPAYLKSLTEKYLINNCHKLILTMSPSLEYEKQFNEAENTLLESKLQNLSSEQINSIYEKGQTLLSDQQKEENLDCLPDLKIEELKKNVDRYDLVNTQVSNIPVQLAIQPTNGICYYRGILNTQHLSSHLKNILPVFNYVMTKMGTKNYNYREWDKETQLKTGGLTFSNHVAESKDNGNDFEEGILIDSYCLEHNSGKMWKLWEELFNRVDLSNLQRFETLVKMEAASLANSISHAGHSYAMSAAASLVSPIGQYKETLSGMEFINKMKQIAQTKDLSFLLNQVQQISDEILKKSNMRSAINLTNESKDEILKELEYFYKSMTDIKGCKDHIYTKNKPVEMSNKAVHHVLPYTVNYASKAISTVPYSHPDYAPLQLLSKLVTSIYLHPEIREKGGAYGGGATLGMNGTFYFYSYRDPNSTRTLDLFDNAWDFFKKSDVTDEKLVEAKLQIFQKLDAPVSPGNRGMSKFLNNLSYDDIQNLRTRLKSVTRDELFTVGERYLSPDADNVKVGRALIGPDNPELKYRQLENWTVFDQDKLCQAQAI